MKDGQIAGPVRSSPSASDALGYRESISAWFLLSGQQMFDEIIISYVPFA